MATKKELLKLSKPQLVKKCKQYKVSSIGNKSDMIERILSKMNWNIDTSPVIKPKKRNRKSTITKDRNISVTKGSDHSLPPNTPYQKRMHRLFEIHHLMHTNIFPNGSRTKLIEMDWTSNYIQILRMH